MIKENLVVDNEPVHPPLFDNRFSGDEQNFAAAFWRMPLPLSIINKKERMSDSFFRANRRFVALGDAK